MSSETARLPRRRSRRVRLLAGWLGIAFGLMVLLAVIGMVSGRRVVSTASRLHTGAAPAFSARDLVSGREVGSRTTDGPDVLEQAVAAYQLRTPMVSDSGRTISRAYQTLGPGMHADTDSHTFILVDRQGQIRWRRDYSTMFVPPEQLLREIPRLAA